MTDYLCQHCLSHREDTHVIGCPGGFGSIDYGPTERVLKIGSPMTESPYLKLADEAAAGARKASYGCDDIMPLVRLCQRLEQAVRELVDKTRPEVLKNILSDLDRVGKERDEARAEITLVRDLLGIVQEERDMMQAEVERLQTVLKEVGLIDD